MTTAAEALDQLTARSGMPASATFLVTDRCNYDCVHCYQEHTARDELDFSEIERILAEMASAGVLLLTLMGGEFFMRPDADDILRAAKRLGFAIRLKTTGHHIHERRADFIATLQPIHVDLSMYAATPHLHDRVTRQEGSWRRTYAAATRLIARGVRVQLNAPVTEQTAADLASLTELAAETGADLSFDPKITSMENGNQSPVSLRMSEQTLAQFYGKKRTGDFLADTYAKIDFSRPVKPLGVTPCRAAQNSVTITPRGEVWPCNALPLKCGDLRTQSFAEIWQQSSRLDEIRNLRWATIAECNQCELRPFCDRCHGMALLEQGDIRGPSLEACRHAVAVRDSLRSRGVLPSDHTALPPTWARVDADGQHHAPSDHRRPAALRIIK